MRISLPIAAATVALALAYPHAALAQTAAPVIWDGKVNVITVGPSNNGLQKTAGCAGCPDAGAYSQQTISSGNGYVEFTAPSTTQDYVVGLTAGDASGTSGSMNWGIQITSIGVAEIREFGVYKGEWNYAPGDTFRIAITGGAVIYTHNGGAPQASTTAPSYPAKADTAFLSVGATVQNVMIAASTAGSSGPAVIWDGKVNVATVGTSSNGLQKTAGCQGCPDAGAYSQQTIASGDGYLEFTAPATTQDYVVGLTVGDASSTSASLKWSVQLTSIGVAEIREFGVYKGEWNYAAGDTFRIAITGGAVIYTHNGGAPYASAVAAAYPIKADTSFLSVGAAVHNVLIGGGSGPVPPTTVPTSYNVVTDHVVRPKPAAPPPMPAAGATVSDETNFGTPGHPVVIRRVTDGTSLGSSPLNGSYHTPSALSQTAWSKDGERFYVMNDGGAVLVFDFNSGAPVYNRQLAWNQEPAFSQVTANLMYGTRNMRTHVVEQYDFNAPAGTDPYSALLDIKTFDPTLTQDVYTHSIYASGGPVERLLVMYGGSSQELDDRVVMFEKNNPANRRVINTRNSTINGAPANVTLGFTMHAAFIDRSGRYAVLYPTGTGCCTQYLYDWNTNAITVMNAASSGHDSFGYGVRINQEASSDQAYDAAQWQFRSLATPNARQDRITPMLVSEFQKMVYEGDHSSWHNAQPTTLVPVLSALSRYWDAPWRGPNGEANDVQWRPWDDEIVAIATTGPTVVWRFAHHWSDETTDNLAPYGAFYYQPHLQVAPNGRWATFTSNWNKTLGDNSQSTDPAAVKRVDVFLIKLP